MSKAENTECPTCGKDHFETERGMRSHHSQVHDEPLEGETIQCARCGEEIETDPWQVEEYDEKYCSKLCRNLGMKQKYA